jgi:membrane protein
VHPLTRRLIDRSPARLRTPVTLVLRTAGGALDDRLPGLAAELAFWVLLSLPALLLTAIAGLSVVAEEGSGWQDQLINRIIDVSSVALSAQAIQSVRSILEQLVSGTTLSLVSVAFVATVWTASRAVKVVLVTIAITYGAQPPPGFGQRLLGFGLTVAALLIGIVVAPLLVAGPGFGERLVDLGIVGGEVLAVIWRVAYWPTAVVLVTAALASLYHVGAPWNTRWLRDLPGAVLATSLWIAGSGALRLYGAWILGSDSIYGPLAGPIVGLLWLWVSGFAVLLGAEFNAQVERRWPSRDEHGEGPDASRLKRLAAGATGRFSTDRSEARRGA